MADDPPSTESSQRATFVSTSIDHPRLVRLDSESIRIFLRQYRTYCQEIMARASQLVPTGFTTTEPMLPISITFCVDSEQLQSAIALGLIENVTDDSTLTEALLLAFLNKKGKDGRRNLTSANNYSLIEKELNMDMTVSSASSRIKQLFINYHSILRRQGLKWILGAIKK